MGIKEIEQKILEEAEKEAQKIKADADAKASEIADAAKVRAEAAYQDIISKAKVKAEGLKKSILVPARLEARKNILSAKHEILNEAFAGFSHKKREENLEKVANILFK